MERFILSAEELKRITARLPETRIGFLGDVCLDLYWYADMRRSVLSLETTHFPLPVEKEEMSPGAGGNVVQNIRALGVREVFPVSVIAPDWRGGLLMKCLEERGISLEYFVQDSRRVTPCYCKPVRMGHQGILEEDARLDFENAQGLSSETEDKVVAALNSIASRVDVLAVSDQYEHGVITEKIRGQLSHLGRQGLAIVADSRHHLRKYRNVTLKPNQFEAQRSKGIKETPAGLQPEDVMPVALHLFNGSRRPVVITLGGRGSLYFDGKSLVEIPSKPVPPPLDTVGAGDTFLAAFCAAIAAGAPGPSAAAFANLASGVTVKKLRTTGTATPQEIIDWFGERP